MEFSDQQEYELALPRCNLLGVHLVNKSFELSFKIVSDKHCPNSKLVQEFVCVHKIVIFIVY